MGKLLVATPPHHCDLPKDDFTGRASADRRGSVYVCDCTKIWVFDFDHYGIRWQAYNPNRRHLTKQKRQWRAWYKQFLEAQRD